MNFISESYKKEIEFYLNFKLKGEAMALGLKRKRVQLGLEQAKIIVVN